MRLAITLTLLFAALIFFMGVPISFREYAARRNRWDLLQALLAAALAAWFGHAAWWVWTATA